MQFICFLTHGRLIQGYRFRELGDMWPVQEDDTEVKSMILLNGRMVIRGPCFCCFCSYLVANSREISSAVFILLLWLQSASPAVLALEPPAGYHGNSCQGGL